MSNDDGSDNPTQRNAWWLSTRRRRPEWQSLRAAGTASFSGRPRAPYEAAMPGDPGLLYLSKPDHAIRAVGIGSQGSGRGDGGPGIGGQGLQAEIADSQVSNSDSRLPTPDSHIEVQ